MKRLAVLSNEEQYKAFKESVPDAGDIVVVCDSLPFRTFLDANDQEYVVVEEGALKALWNEINLWAFDKALNWTEATGRSGHFRGIEINNALYVFLTCYLVAFLKNYLYAEYLSEKFRPEEVILFDQADTSTFPGFNGNVLLSSALREMSAKYGYEVNNIHVFRGRVSSGAVLVKETLRKVIQKCYSALPPVGRRREIFLSCGSLRHLGPVLAGIKKTGHDVSLYDFDFHLEQYRFSEANGFGYLVPDTFRSSRLEKAASAAYNEYFTGVLGTLESRGWFNFRGKDLGRSISGAIRATCREHIRTYARDYAIYDRLLAKLKVKALLVDEDWGPKRGFMAAFFKERGIPRFCVSHGYGAQRFSVPGDKMRFFLTETFVNSDFEKELYMARGWDGEHIHPTGIPKNDAFFGKKKRNGNRNGERPVFLFCGTSLNDFQLTHPAYMGLTQFERGDHMKAYLRAVLLEIKDYDARLIVRPHPSDMARFKNEKQLWTEATAPFKGHRCGIELCLENCDFFDILPQCDAMFIGYWTPSIVEALLLDIPTLVLSFFGIEDGFPFAKEGLCEIAGDREALRRFIGKVMKCHPDNSAFHGKSMSREKIERYLGKNDGCNTERTVAKIFELLGK
ncbi:MAG: hypothetical protein HQL30_02115 [Candidatus Omnitrophica bacterium]|nr:hypothetical protein [Candidatus Omnitrophota bacterium]